MLNRIIRMNSLPANKVRREYFLRASVVSCVISFRKNLFFCGALCHITHKKSAVLKHTVLTVTSPSLAVHLRHFYRTPYLLLPVYFGRLTPFIASRFLSAVRCMTLRGIHRHSSSAFVSRAI
jgi:hypothetical protein